MSVEQTAEPADFVPRTQWPRVRRDPTELPQATFRTALRGFDRDEVRNLLEDVAADYHALQMQNASLTRQLANFEAVLVASLREESPVRRPAPGSQQQGDRVLQRANDEAQAILTRAHAQAEEITARARARVRTVEPHVEQLEQEQKRFRTVLGATISDLLTVLTMTRRDQDGSGHHQQHLAEEMLAREMSIDAPVSRPAVTGGVTQTPTQTGPSSARSAVAAHKGLHRADGNGSAANARGQVGTPAATVT